MEQTEASAAVSGTHGGGERTARKAATALEVVVAVDASEESLHALNWCLANVVSPAGGDTLLLVHARRPRPVYAAMDSAGMTYYYRRLQL